MEYTREDIQRSAELLEQTFRLFNKRLAFSVNEEIGRVVVKVIDAQTDKVIKEIPPAEIQRLIARIKETIGPAFRRADLKLTRIHVRPEHTRCNQQI